MPHTVRIEDTGVSYACAPRESLLEGMHRLGLRGIPVGCRGGGCDDDVAHHRLLACRVYPVSDLSLKVIGKLQKKVCTPLAVR